MISMESYIHTRAFARVDGGKLGLLWLLSFALFVGNFYFPLCGMLWMLTMMATPFAVGILARRYADAQLGGHISYRRAFAYSALVVFYASLILAIVQWAYFEYIDHGFVIGKYASLLGDKEVARTMEAMGYSEAELSKLVETLRSLRPIDIALQILWSNIVAGLIVSLSSALYASVRKTYK